MSDLSDLVRTLGGPALVPARSLRRLRELARAGLPYASLTAVVSGFRIGASDAIAILRIPTRTLARRRLERRLSAEESDRLLRLGRIATLAEGVLGSRDKAAAWLQAANRALGGERPLDHLDTDPGAEEVESLLLRAAHGVYS